MWFNIWFIVYYVFIPIWIKLNYLWLNLMGFNLFEYDQWEQ